MGNWNPDTNQNTPNFVDLHNSQQHVLQEFVDTNIVKEETLEQKALRENSSLADFFELATKTVNEIGKSLSHEEFWPYNEEYTLELIKSATTMLAKWNDFSAAIQGLLEQHDALVGRYNKCAMDQITKGLQDDNSEGNNPVVQ